MSIVGTVESLWRYPVKSMRGEELPEIFAGYGGVFGDRLYAFHSTGSRPGLPYLTAREKTQMLRYRPRFRYPDKTIFPPSLAATEKMGATPLPGNPADLFLEVETPDGTVWPIDDPALRATLREGLDENHQLTLFRSERALTDCRPLSLISTQSIEQLAAETGAALDRRQFRANIYLDLTSKEGFAEDAFVGSSLRIGAHVTLAIVERDSRCMILTLHPETGEKTPAVLQTVAQKHEGRVGLYAVVLVEGIIRRSDPVELLR
ncbi:MAG: MOSC domain-containing protein [Spartobacteria bacterium]